MRNNVSNSRTSLINAFQATDKALQDQLDNYAEIIDNLSNTVIPQLQADIEGTAGTSNDINTSSRGGEQTSYAFWRLSQPPGSQWKRKG